KILYNIGQVQAQLGRPHKALAAMESYLSDGGDDITKERREKVSKEVDTLKKLVGTVIIDGQDGSEAWIDGENAGRLPLNGEIALSAGTHRLVVRFGEQTPCEKVFTVYGATMTTVSCYIDLNDSPGKELSEESASWQMNARLKALPLTETKSSKSTFLTKIAPWIAVGLTVVFAGTATGTAIKARKINSDLNDNCNDGACDPKYKDSVDSLPKLAAATDALFITAGVFAVGATLLFTAPWDRKKGDNKKKNVAFSLRGGQL
ncbi:MAG: hypothetical protein JXR91_11785, partial [Deltaproteobacteria bacterium]|nr:hypothetical protein [Deltaproteobacteria bacterium]